MVDMGGTIGGIGDPFRAEEIRDLYFQQVSTDKRCTDIFAVHVFCWN